MRETRFPIGSIIICVVLLALACFVIFGDRHVRDATVMIDDGRVYKNAQVDMQPFKSDVRITQAQDGNAQWVSAKSIRSISGNASDYYLGPWAWTAFGAAITVVIGFLFLVVPTLLEILKEQLAVLAKLCKSG